MWKQLENNNNICVVFLTAKPTEKATENRDKGRVKKKNAPGNIALSGLRD